MTKAVIYIKIKKTAVSAEYETVDMKYTIMLKMLFMLLAKKRITAKEVAEKFDISVRSVYRYVDELSFAHVPVMTERGSGGGISISETFKIPSSFLTKEEFSTLIELLNGVSPQLKKAKVFESMTEKLLAAKSPRDVKLLGSSSLIIDGSGWNDYGYNEKFSLISKAINETVAVKISYHDRNGETSVREIEPHVIVLKHGVWYVYAYCRNKNAFRFFKIGRIEYARLTSPFMRRDIVAEDLPFDSWFKTAEKVDVELSIDRSVKSDVEEWLGVENVTELPSGNITATCRLPYDKSLISEIMKYGNAVKVVRPEKLKKDILKNAEQLVGLYS